MQSTPLLCLLQTCLHQREPQKAGSIPGEGMEFVVSFLNCFFWGEGGQDKSLLSIGIKCLRPTKCCTQPGDRTSAPDALTPACPAPLPSAAPPPQAAPIALLQGHPAHSLGLFHRGLCVSGTCSLSFSLTWLQGLVASPFLSASHGSPCWRLLIPLPSSLCSAPLPAPPSSQTCYPISRSWA